MSETIILESDQSTVCLKIIFERQGDRWSHRLAAGNGEETILLRSVEGNESQDWPPSPPLQEVNQHQLANENAVLAVGMAGHSHWSASFSIDSGEILVELACLCKSQPDFLGSQYEIADNVTAASTNKSEVGLQSGNYRVAIRPLVATDWSTRLQNENRNLTIRPNELSKVPGQATRWGYRINLIDTG